MYRKNTHNPNVVRLVEWLFSDEGQTMIEACGYVRLPDEATKPFIREM